MVADIVNGKGTAADRGASYRVRLSYVGMMAGPTVHAAGALACPTCHHTWTLSGMRKLLKAGLKSYP